METCLGVLLHARCLVAKGTKQQKCARKIFNYNLQYIYRTLQFIVFLTLSAFYKTSNRALTHTYKMHTNRCVLQVISTCGKCDSLFCALHVTALIKPNWCVLLYCCACCIIVW